MTTSPFSAMRAICLSAQFCLMAGNVSAQPTETVTVNASALVGVWKIGWPQWGHINFGGTAWGPMADRFCRIEQVKGALEIRCFGPGGDTGNFAVGTVNLEGTKIHFAWGNMLLRLVMDGTMQSPTRIAGIMGVKLSGIERENPAPSNGAKFSLSEVAPDKPGKAFLLRTALEQLTKGALILPHDNAAIGKTRGALPSGIASLGTMQTIVYLGSSSRELPSTNPGIPNIDLDYFSVYAAEFDSGERICGLHQRPDGVLDAFLCV